jgi:hypothetical protein
MASLLPVRDANENENHTCEGGREEQDWNLVRDVVDGVVLPKNKARRRGALYCCCILHISAHILIVRASSRLTIAFIIGQSFSGL